jgi:hypothetical protein
MGKFEIMNKVSSKATALWGAFIKKGPVFIALTGVTLLSVLGLGVGGTLAATGVISNPFESQNDAELDSAISELKKR